jgi:arginine decarboxylase
VSVIRIVWGGGGGPTATASYDAALADAGVHDYNLVTVSSVIPAGPPVEAVGTAPDLGPVGNRLTVVQGRATVEEGAACAGLGWLRDGDGSGVFYEASGTDPETVRETVEGGLDASCVLRDWTPTDRGGKYVTASDEREYTTAVVLAVYGESEPIVR